MLQPGRCHGKDFEILYVNGRGFEVVPKTWNPPPPNYANAKAKILRMCTLWQEDFVHAVSRGLESEPGACLAAYRM